MTCITFIKAEISNVFPRLNLNLLNFIIDILNPSAQNLANNIIPYFSLQSNL
ncbi:hypothetical protein CSC2_46060 [Clostridium zeae]|uniref:Uncharacterized protein n=1 Tax=Clostridium zeae TaxID=2759022 RepID=A0ABQ1EHH7_9CLOT|nr:hypothetical protein CSC2_46060 [Clostridium zeae]